MSPIMYGHEASGEQSTVPSVKRADHSCKRASRTDRATRDARHVRCGRATGTAWSTEAARGLVLEVVVHECKFPL